MYETDLAGLSMLRTLKIYHIIVVYQFMYKDNGNRDANIASHIKMLKLRSH